MERLEYESIYGYCRVSSDEQAKHGTSLNEQKKDHHQDVYVFV